MAFDFTEAQEMFRREVQRFAQTELAPTAKQRAKADSVSKEYFKKIAEAGLLGLGVPEEYGGQGASDWVTLGIAVEELAKVEPGIALSPILPKIGSAALQHAAEPLLAEWLPKAVRGEVLGCCFALTEPEAGADAGGIKMTAVRDGDYYILNGEKTSITMGYYADTAMLFAKTDPTRRTGGITCFWVPLDLPGITRSRLPHTGLKPWGAASIIMDQVHLPAIYRCGEEGKGFFLFWDAVTFQRVCLALLALGIAEASLEETMNYVVQRTAFGRPIASFEGVSFKIVEHATRLEAARLLCYRTLSLADKGAPNRKEAAMCKWWCPEIAFDAVHDCILLHGHVGYSEEYPLEQRLRDVMGLEFTDSMAQIMKIIIARELMGRVAAAY
jgi:cyclohexanecarboxyl-CoA dehydrogenase